MRLYFTPGTGPDPRPIVDRDSGLDIGLAGAAIAARPAERRTRHTQIAPAPLMRAGPAAIGASLHQGSGSSRNGKGAGRAPPPAPFPNPASSGGER